MNFLLITALLLFCEAFLHLYSSEILTCSFLMESLFWYKGNAALIK